MNGVTFNGKHSYNDYGLVMVSKNRPIIPEPKLVYEDLPGVDGEYDFSAVNPDGRTKYKNIVHEVEFKFKAKSIAEVRTKAHQIAIWLSCGEAQLSFDDDPGLYWIGRVANKLDLENQLISARSFTVQFKCQPYAYAAAEIEGVYNNITGAVNKVIANPGTYVRPKITVTGTFTTLTLTCGGKTLTYNAAISGSVIVIDNFQCIKDGTTNVGFNLYGNPFELANGNNTLGIGGTGLNCSVTVKFRPRYR